MDVMTLPTPEDPGRGPVWDNYVVAQATGAALGLIPRNALALGVEVDGWEVTLRCQLRVLTDEDEDELRAIASELEILIGGRIHVGCAQEVRAEPSISPHDGICWIYVART
jgi:hypothetical protein